MMVCIMDYTIDEIRETFIDINMGVLLELHESLQNDYEESGFLNTSVSHKFVQTLVEGIVLNENYLDISSEDET